MTQRLPLAIGDALARVISANGVAWCERYLRAFFDDYEFSAMEFRFFADLLSNAASKPADACRLARVDCGTAKEPRSRA